MPDAGLTNTPETPTEAPTPTDGNTTAAPEPSLLPRPDLPEGAILPVNPHIPLGCDTRVRHNRPRPPRDPNKPKKPWVPTRLGKQQKEYLRGYGVDPDKYNEAELAAIYHSAPFFNRKISVAYCHLTGVKAIEDQRETMKWARDILENNDKPVPVELKLEAAKIISECGKTLAKLTKQVVETADKTAERSAPTETMNKPPTFAFQVNVGPSPQPANNGTVLPPQIPPATS